MDPCQRQVARQREEAAQLRVKVMQDQPTVVNLEVKWLSRIYAVSMEKNGCFTKQLRKGMSLPRLTELSCWTDVAVF